MIKLPDLFANKLAADPGLHASVQSSFAAFSPWLAGSGMPFFPGFTDHSPTHITDVLNSAASLISDSSHALITPEDISVLCLAVLLHDCGMHLTADSFRSLINKSDDPIVKGFSDVPWPQLWKEFLGEAHRFGQEKLLAIFGEPTPLRLDALDLNNLNEKDYLLIGEFVRRHHTRLAHEIAIVGVGRTGADPIRLIGVSDAICDMAGLVARSHGMPIRKTFDYLKNKYGNIAVCRKVKVPYLMAVLRIADYIQVKSERAIAGLLSVKELKSPISRQEWRNHFAIADVHTFHADPEAIFVEAAPTDVKTFSKLEYLFKDIQRELDESWATLGEVYGRVAGLDKLGLNSRRIRSTLDSVEDFSRTVNYIPVKAKFDSSGPELLKLLVGPLYDYQISVGVRELLQNAIDACREAEDLYAKRGFDRVGHEKDIIVEIVEGRDNIGYLQITDTGVGMTVETITRYFLIAGASFRNSDVWKRQHMDQSGNNTISRGGRFGVGALAAFLLGEEIDVITRHIDRSNNEGVSFSARIDDPHVQLTKCVAPQGTSLKVTISDKKILNQLRPIFPLSINEGENVKLDSWHVVNWFLQKNPRVLFKWTGFNMDTARAEREGCSRIYVTAEFEPQEYEMVPGSPASTDAPSWHSLENIQGYAGMMWRYQRLKPKRVDNDTVLIRQSDQVVVNGLRVQTLSNYGDEVQLPKDELISGPSYKLHRPSLAVFDPAGICPINLQRSRIAFAKMGIDEHLASSVLNKQIRNFVEKLKFPKTLGDLVEVAKDFSKLDGFKFDGQISPLAIFNGGLTILDSEVLGHLRVSRIVIIDPAVEDLGVEIQSLCMPETIICIRSSTNAQSPQSMLAWFRGVFTPDETIYYSRNIGLPSVSPNVKISAVSNSVWKFVNEKGRVAKVILSPLKVEDFGSRKIVYSSILNNVKSSMDLIVNFYECFSINSEISVWEIGEKIYELKETLFVKAWVAASGGLVLFGQK